MVIKIREKIRADALDAGVYEKYIWGADSDGERGKIAFSFGGTRK